MVTETFSARRRGSSPETWVQLGNQSPDIGSTGVSLMVQEPKNRIPTKLFGGQGKDTAPSKLREGHGTFKTKGFPWKNRIPTKLFGAQGKDTAPSKPREGHSTFTRNSLGRQ